MKIGDRCFVNGYVDEIRKDTIIIKNAGGYFGTDPEEVIVVNDIEHPDGAPTIEPRPRGRWILNRSGAYCCSKCMEPCATYVMMKPRDRFCKMCGARMEKEETR